MAKKYFYEELDADTQERIFDNLSETFPSVEEADDFINRHNWKRTKRGWLKLKGIVE